VVVIAGFAAVFSCTSALYFPSESGLNGEATLSELKEGRKLYIRNCGGCHTLYLPGAYKPEEWQYWMRQMESRVKLDSTEKELILKYVNGGN
jgi:mono/diheme cytochrome c family protein